MTGRFELASSPIPEGVALVEASAGTGKTYTIVGLVLRLLLEGRVEGIERILVVTFTNAATDELKVRIRGTLAAGAEALERGRSDDPLLDALARRHGPAGARRLRDALSAFDEASILTIHGFCQRMLVHAAFDSGVPFATDFVEDDGPLRLAVARDFFRREVLWARPLEAAALARARVTPESLAGAARTLGRHRRTTLLPEAEPLAAARAGLARAAAALAPTWEASELPSGLESAAVRIKDGHPVIADPAALLARVEAFVRGDHLEGLDDLALITSSGLEKALKKKSAERLAADPFVAACDRLFDAIAPLVHSLRAAFVAYARDRFEELKRRSNVLAFDDLLGRLLVALEEPGRGESLARSIRDRYGVALIDEFQDTDGLQHGIFERVFGAGPCLLIGDPKQAIYAFRGADVFAYLTARARATERYTLERSYRSSRGLVEALNTLFARPARPFVFPEIPYGLAESAGVADREPLAGDGRAPLVLWWADSRKNKTDALSLIEPALAAEVVRLLGGGARLGGRELVPSDIAVLVRTNDEARQVQQLLRSVGVPGVVGSTGDVFESEEAAELNSVLAAVADPRSAPTVRAALATRALGATAATIAALATDEHAWGDLVEELEDHRSRWGEAGFMPMFQALLAERGVRQRLLGGEDGPRRLTNLLHLAELAQRAEAEGGLAPSGLVAWLEAARGRQHAEREAAELRLETDDDAVRIVTVHKAKGLEYEVVFCPFLWGAKPVAGPPAVAHPTTDTLVVDYGSEQLARHLAMAEAERLAEDLRLAYVALTRARHRCYVAFGPIGRGVASSRSALAYLLHGPDQDDGTASPSEWCRASFEAIAQRVDSWRAEVDLLVAASHGSIEVEDLEEGQAVGRHLPSVRTHEALEARRARLEPGQLEPWGVQSFSSFVRGAAAERPDHVDPDAGTRPTAGGTEPDGLLAFARGRRAGACIHEVLETCDLTAPDSPEAAALVAAALARHGLSSAAEHAGGPDYDPAAAVRATLVRLAATTLPAGGLRFGGLSPADRLSEWQFYAPLAELSPSALAGPLAAHGLDPVRSGYAPGLERLSPRRVRGFLTGFVDALCVQDGRWFVVDWKSNHLGDRVEDYGPEALWSSMTEHHYVLQYHLYVLALHRHLAARLADYDYDRDFGGVAYVFLRGLGGPGDLGVYEDRPPRPLVEALDALVAGREDA